ncbi:AraC family transcriptional regulator [Streptomyces sp. NPDC058301]
MPWTQGAACWGYPQPDRFSRTFRIATGITPSEYRTIQGHQHLPAGADQ